MYITTPIYYVNDKPHIGHAYTTVAADCLARYHRLRGEDVYFLTGTDEHGQKVEQAAARNGVAPQAFTDTVSETFRTLATDLNASHDQFIRTTEARHYRTAQALWQRMADNGYIYLDSYKGWYSVRDEAYYQENELIDGKAPTGADVTWVEEPSYFFRLSAFGERLLDHYARHPDFIAPKARRNEVTRFVEGGLKDLSISRTTFSWGIPVPTDSQHIMYVWLDALSNYLTAIGWPDGGPLAHHWPASVHIVGKDIVRFHAVYWPAFLMAADLPLPGQIFAHGWWTNEGEKISKSLGNVIDPYDLIQTYGLDPMRFFLLRQMGFGQDGDFSKTEILRRTNQDLAGMLGNLAQRVLSFAAKHLGTLPQKGTLTPEDQALLDSAYTLPKALHTPMAELQFTLALEAVWQVVGAGNRYIDAQAPWGLRKTDPARMETVLWTVCESLRCIGITLQPFMPTSAATLLDTLGASARMLADCTPGHAVQGGTPLTIPAPLFPRVEE